MIAPLLLALVLQGPDTARVVTGEFSSPLGTRRYQLFVPARTDQTPRPLVVMLHGCAQGPADLARASRFNELAARERVLVLYPEQPASANALRCWNWFLPAHQAAGQGEPAIIAALTSEIAAAWGADGGRVYIGGLSAGAAMAVLVAIAHPSRFAAVAAHSGVPWRAAAALHEAVAVMRGQGAEPPALPVARPAPLLIIHGVQDTVLRVRSSHQLAAQFAATWPGVAADSGRESDNGYHLTRVTWRVPGRRAAVIEALFVDELGHALSGGAAGERYTDPRGPDAARAMLRFFLEH